ncbi:MAG TPA: methyltransferase, FxLD system [Blastocatellia bacterium]|nr:methyltransferase, FxLD system [Blastocatellia bacterium]
MTSDQAPKSDLDVTALHQALVDDLKRTGVLVSPEIEAAFRAIPRHLFLPTTPLEDVYRDAAVMTKLENQAPVSSSSQPSMMALMLEQLELEPGHRVLEIGAGTGFNAALMAHIVGETGDVVTVDIDEDLVEAARRQLEAAGYQRVRVVTADGGSGYEPRAPYDRIVLTVGTPDIAPAWLEQLKPGGRLLAPLSITETGTAKSIAFVRCAGHLESVSIKDCAFIMLRGAFAAPAAQPRPIGPEPGLLYREFRAGEAKPEPDIYQILTSEAVEVASGLDSTTGELFSRFLTWLVLQPTGRGIQGCSVTATGPQVDRGLVPYLAGQRGRVCASIGIVSAGSLALLMRSPSSGPPAESPAEDPPFELYIRSYGKGGAAAAQLGSLLREWDAAGRPPDSKVTRVRAYPRTAGYIPLPGELVADKPNVRLVIDWTGS